VNAGAVPPGAARVVLMSRVQCALPPPPPLPLLLVVFAFVVLLSRPGHTSTLILDCPLPTSSQFSTSLWRCTVKCSAQFRLRSLELACQPSHLRACDLCCVNTTTARQALTDDPDGLAAVSAPAHTSCLPLGALALQTLR